MTLMVTKPTYPRIPPPEGLREKWLGGAWCYVWSDESDGVLWIGVVRDSEEASV